MRSSEISPIRPDNHTRHRSCPADSIRSGLQRRELAVHVVIHQGGALVGFLQDGVNDDAPGDVLQFRNGRADHQCDGSTAVHRNDRLGIHAAGIGDELPGGSQGDLLAVLGIPEGIAAEIDGKGTVRIAAQNPLEGDLVGNPRFVVSAGPVGKGHRAAALQPSADLRDAAHVRHEAGTGQQKIVIQ